MNATDNPLLDFSGLPRFDAIRAAHVTPAIDRLLADARAAAEIVATDTRPPTWDNVVVPLDDALDRHRPRVGRGQSSQCRRQFAGAARGLQRQPAASSPTSTPISRRICASTAAIARWRRRRRFAASDPAQRRAIENELRDFRLGGRRAAGRAQGALQGAAGRALRAVVDIRGQRARRDQRLGALRRERSRARRRAGRRAARGAAPRRPPRAGAAASSRCGCRRIFR